MGRISAFSIHVHVYMTLYYVIEIYVNISFNFVPYRFGESSKVCSEHIIQTRTKI